MKIVYPLLGMLILCSAVAAHVSLDHPVGGEIFGVGDTVIVQWHVNIAHEQENWDLYFSADGGTTWESIRLDIPVDRLSYEWRVPEVLTQEAQIRIVMDNTAGPDYGAVSGDFTIQETVTGIGTAGMPPQTARLHRNYPNPFNPSTTIRYELSRAAEVDLTVYTLLGQAVRTLVQERQGPDGYRIQWNGRDAEDVPVQSGIYLYVLTTGSFRQARKMVLLR